jgi:hypothetical protein
MPDRLKSLLQIASLLLWALCASQFASAQSGSSLPTFSDDTLTIPRIDVEGYGSLELQLQLVDTTNPTFQLTSSLAANPSLTPGATNENFEALKLNTSTLQPDDNGIVITPQHVHRSLCDFLGVQDDLDKLFPIGVEKLDLFS